MIMKANELTYDVEFNDDTTGVRKGFISSYQECLDYIEIHNGTDWSYFEDYKSCNGGKAGSVSIVCNETEETVYEVEVFSDFHEWRKFFKKQQLKLTK